MFKFDEICELIRLVASTGVAALEVDHGGSKLRIDGVPPVVVADPSAGGAMVAAAPRPAAEPAAGSLEALAAADEGLHWVTSPIVGTFYRAPNPDAEPYVKVGDIVREGQTLCIVEAMKLMNEIECEVAGTVVKVLPDNAQPVEYGERLFAIRPA
ncbi:MAG TPA: acetyl-CoA carboxylase biotin carboxyl carrier protein [Thermoanaerobaculales bacterium]|nr:acetyl-CoA carboxylase biotin carboxyl carrier protein [Thermoanaerobaculales bacterium]HPA79614.1 acetyl-CoA carboxylase biotin carboxyl carrier protein [Thermoanaerobaculales bacterium]HQL31520.1 acetyl-CoA carboxylase biotin carboxyl carrier protein [Thermoanaerobaculales bacterium]